MFYQTPKLPRALLHLLAVSERTFERDPARGGQTKPVDTWITSFWGVVLPLSNKDWRALPEGTFTANTQKVYTDELLSPEVKPGCIIRDTYDGQLYTISQILEHNTIHPLLRFLVEGVVKP